MPDQPLPPGAGVLIYTRVSPRPEGEDGEISVESQLAELQALAARSGWAVLGTYTDQLVSGSTEDRPAFQELIATATSDPRVQGVLGGGVPGVRAHRVPAAGGVGVSYRLGVGSL